MEECSVLIETTKSAEDKTSRWFDLPIDYELFRDPVSYTHLDVYKRQVLETIITNIDIHTKERKSNGCGYKTEHVGLGLRGVSKEQLEKGDRAVSYTHPDVYKSQAQVCCPAD